MRTSSCGDSGQVSIGGSLRSHHFFDISHACLQSDTSPAFTKLAFRRHTYHMHEYTFAVHQVHLPAWTLIELETQQAP